MSSLVLQSTLFLLIPLFSIGLAFSRPLKPLAYIYIASVTLLSTLAGALPLSHSSNSLSEHLIQALLFLFSA
ncbi:hypothetical protein BYT27DRAFT_7200417 [Phlegmacium glaucopus]|nr:hypothetical protein BYT27DRAFT_7200417 [Phlegmacium glaucopus]